MTRIATWTASHASAAALRGDSAAILAPLCGLLYYLAASLDLALRGPDAVPVLSPQHGVLIALLMVTPYERWWALAAAVLPAHLIAYWSTGLPVGQLAWQALFSLGLSTSIGTALRLLLGQRSPFDNLQDFSLYVVTGVIAGPALLTIFSPSVALAWIAGNREQALAHWQTGTVASALAILTWSSWIYLALLPQPGWLQKRTPKQYVEALTIAAALLACFQLTFISDAEHHAALYLFFIPLLWQSVRFGVDAAAMAVTLIATLASSAEHIPHSVRLRDAPQAATIDLQIFLIVMTLIAVVIAIVVEERRRVAQAAAESDARYRAIVDSQTDFVCRSLPDTTLTFANAAICRYFGMPREKVLGVQWLQFVPSDTRGELRQALGRATPENPTFMLKHPVTLPDGRTGWHEWTNTAIFDSEQRLVEFQGTGRDITELARAELALRQNDERLSFIARAACDLIYEWDIVRGELWSSSGGERNECAPSVRHLSVETWGNCVHPVDRDRVARDCRVALRGSATTWEAEYLYIGRGGPPRWVRHRAYIVRDRNGKAVRMIGAITDRSDRKNLEEANRTLERFARLAMVGQITASIAHEINQPLGAIRYNAEAGLLFLNRDNYDKDEFQEIFDDIRRDNRRASDLVTRLRELLHDHELRLDPIDVNDVIRDVVKLMRVESRQRHVQLETQCSELPTVLGDYGRLQQVLLNLILNGMDAMAGQPEACRRIAIRTARVGATRIQVEVADRGCGIDPATLPKMFDSFFTSKAQGMGLGLAIARSIVEAHGGRIWAENNADGAGATLIFQIDSLGSKVMLSGRDDTDRYSARLN
ncbi:ATP-binding protein [Steroidobacter flavus]|uniref:histidine kinase n=1 Tax=Steroidobacter flavus TaxID=1842136 RepID=A0ABV8T4B8_9GAMM